MPRTLAALQAAVHAPIVSQDCQLSLQAGHLVMQATSMIQILQFLIWSLA